MPTEHARLPFEIDNAIDPTLVTGRAGVPLVIELFRQLGVAATIDAHVAIKQRQRGLTPAQLVESLIVLWASGGDRCQDLTMLRGDQALAILLGHPLPAATTMRDFLEAFHVEDGPLWAAGPQATIPLESAPLAGLDTANRTLVAGLSAGPERRRPPWMWMPRSWRVTRTPPPWPTTGPGAISRWWSSGGQDVIVHDNGFRRTCNADSCADCRRAGTTGNFAFTRIRCR